MLRKALSDVAREGLFWTSHEKRQRQTPKTTKRSTTEKERKSTKLTWGEIWKVAQDHSHWRETVNMTDDDVKLQNFVIH